MRGEQRLSGQRFRLKNLVIMAGESPAAKMEADIHEPQLPGSSQCRRNSSSNSFLDIRCVRGPQ